MAAADRLEPRGREHEARLLLELGDVDQLQHGGQSIRGGRSAAGLPLCGGVGRAAVGCIVERVLARRLDPERLAGLRRIGVDEFSYRKRHHYLTVVVDHDKRRVVWAGKGRSAETLEKFFDLLGPSGCEQIVLVTADLAASWQKALRAKVPHAEVVFDRFHVERLASDAVDEV